MGETGKALMVYTWYTISPFSICSYPMLSVWKSGWCNYISIQLCSGAMDLKKLRHNSKQAPKAVPTMRMMTDIMTNFGLGAKLFKVYNTI